MRTPHIVPLSQQTIDILKQIREISGDQELLFPSIHNPSRPMSENTVNKALRLMEYNTKEDVCGHGFRAMACSALIESGLWSQDAVERQMSHQSAIAFGSLHPQGGASGSPQGDDAVVVRLSGQVQRGIRAILYFGPSAVQSLNYGIYRLISLKKGSANEPRLRLNTSHIYLKHHQLHKSLVFSHRIELNVEFDPCKSSTIASVLGVRYLFLTPPAMY
jgi:hypothetical protein